MQKKECPSCAMEVDVKSKICPICNYEFAESGSALKWIVILLAVILLLYFILL